MTYEEALSFIHCTDWKGSKLGLERMQELLSRLGNPERELKYVHVAGTNGKGSTCTLLAAILQEAGYKTGLYTSPHLFRVNERFRINGIDCTDEELILSAEAVKAAADAMVDQPTEFEIITAMAFWYYARKKCDVVVLEVGLGGRIDATNVIPAPEVAVITNLGLEHTEILGDTIEKIAFEKAGIIKPGCTAVAYRSESAALEVLRRVCAERGVPLTVARFDGISVTDRSLRGQTFSWEDHTDLRLRLLGDHQLCNAVTVLETVAALRERGWMISRDAVYAGMEKAQWEARFEVLSEDPLFIADGAHNPQCVEALRDSLRQLLPERKVVFLTGVLADKDYEHMMSMLLPFADSFVCLTPDSPRALDKEALAELLTGKGFPCETADTVERGIVKALLRAQGKPVVACGSLYMMGDIRSSFPRAKKLWQRKRNIAARKAIPVEERKRFDHAVTERIRQSGEYKNARTIMSYIAVRGEVNLAELHALAEKDGKRIVFPNCIDSEHMEALLPAAIDGWRVGMYDIPEPVPERAAVIPPEDIDLMLCPCTAFDEECHRMGMGAGYYDRYLPKCVNARVAAVAFEVQKLAHIPAEPWDHPMEAVFTEANTYR